MGVDVIQDLTNIFIKFYFAKDEAALKNFSEVTLVTALGQLEKRLVSRGGEYFVGNSLPRRHKGAALHLEGDLRERTSQGESGQCAQHQGVGGVQTKDRSLNCPLKKLAASPLYYRHYMITSLNYVIKSTMHL